MALRSATDFARPFEARSAIGPDPYAIVELLDGRFAVLLRASEEVALLDAALVERARAPVPELSCALVALADGTVLVGGPSSPVAVAFEANDTGLWRAPARDRTLPGIAGVRALAAGAEGCVYAAADRGGDIVARCAAGTKRVRVAASPHRLVALDGSLVVASLEGHAVTVVALDTNGLPLDTGTFSATLDGPVFGIAAAQDDVGGLYVVAGGPEDHPLDRTVGSFGYVDSHLFIYRRALPWRGRAPVELDRIATIDVGELGIVVPKALTLSIDAGVLRVVATGYGSDRAAELRFSLLDGPLGPPMITQLASVPGIAAAVERADEIVFVDPLLDAWGTLGPAGVRTVHAPSRQVAVVPPPFDETTLRLGEALFYTSLMAPFQKSDGPLSRFSCETCHFEGGVDGRTHATGRGSTTATTKPLVGIFNDAPHFTRALDLDTTRMVYAEFRVAAANGAGPAWFSIEASGASWALNSGIAPPDAEPEELRRALLLYLAATPHPPNPRVIGRSAFTDEERAGAVVFARRCETCHAARLVADDPGTRVEEARWESLVLSREGAIVWARDGYEKTGVEPYVHPEGARPSSLRRIATRTPYFTSGGARSLDEVLGAARIDGGVFLHAGAGSEAEELSDEEKRGLLAFLELL